MRCIVRDGAADPELAEIQQKAALQSVAAVGPRGAIRSSPPGARSARKAGLQ
jgi:hypothetical protein